MPPASSLVKIHEDRIIRLEEDLTEVRVDVGVVKSQIGDLRDQVADGISMLADKLDLAAAKVDTVDERITKLETNARVALEVEEQTHIRRSRRLKMIGLGAGAIGAICGIVGKFLFGG